MSFIINLPRIELPALQFELPEYVGKPNVERYLGMIERLERLAHKAGTGAASFRRRMQQLQVLLDMGKRANEIVQFPKDIRVLVSLWQEEDTVIEHSPIDQATLNHFAMLRPRQSLLVLFALSQLFFARFDEAGDIKAFAAFLRSQFRLNADRKLSQTLARLAEHAENLFAIEGPAWVARYARRGGLPLAAAAVSLGLPLEREGRFFTQCKNMYYLDTLEELQVGQDHEVLHELVQKDVYESAYEGGWLLGHKVIQILVDKASGHKEMPDNWLRIILTIAGDPRVSTRMPNYVRWWALLGEKYIKRVRQWLSKMDLVLFLKILEDYALHSGDIEMQRMFPARRRFLEGIYEKGLVRDSRLFLSRQAQRYLKHNYRESDIPAYSRVNDASRSVIYLNIDGRYVVEGTHNFSLWVYQQLPPGNPIEDYEQNVIDIRDLGVGLQEQYQAKFGRKDVTNIRHVSGWQHRAITALRELGTYVNPSDILTSEDYRRYRRMYGVANSSPVYLGVSRNL